MRVDLRIYPLPPEMAARRYDRVFLDGVDVTNRCFLADDQEGIVGLYLHDESGHFYRDGDGAASEFRKGVITLIPPPPAPTLPKPSVGMTTGH